MTLRSTDTERKAQFAELQARFIALKDTFKQLDAETEACVKRWRYAEQSAFELRVEYYRRFQTRAGQIVARKPAPSSAYIAYGYDDLPRVHCAIFFSPSNVSVDDLPERYDFYQYTQDYIELTEFSLRRDTKQYDLHKIGRLVQPDAERPFYYAEYLQSESLIQQFFEEYKYNDGGLLKGIGSIQQMYPRPFSWEVPPQPSGTYVEEFFTYYTTQLEKVVRRSRPLAESWAKKITVYDASAQLRAEEHYYAARVGLRNAVVNSIVQIPLEKRLQAPLYNIILSYETRAGGVSITLSLQAQREAWESKTDEHSYRSLQYDTLDWDFDFIAVRELTGDLERFLTVQIRNRNVHNDVARDLNDYDWTGILNVTDDFIIFASDYTALDDVHDEIRACVPENKLRLLRDKGLLD